MKRKHFKYNRHVLLIGLNIILLLCTYIIIRDCELPIIVFNSNIDKYIESIFLKTTKDTTLYNISISFLAAYIFFIIQIYIPSVVNNKHGIKLLENNIIKDINNIKLLLLIISELTKRNKNELHIKEEIDEIYIIEQSQMQIFRFTFSDSYKYLKELILSRNNNLLSNVALSYLDNNLSELFYVLPIEDLLVVSDNIYNQKCNNTHAIILDNGSIEKTEFIIAELEKRYKFCFEVYSVTTDLIYQGKYISQTLSLTSYTQNELELKIKI